MSANAVDQRLSFQHGLGKTVRLAVTAASANTAGGEERDRLKPGKYYLQLLDHSSARCWIRVGASVTLAAAEPAAPVGVTVINDFPLDPTDGVTAVELHVRKDKTDVVAAIMSAGTGTLLLTRMGE
jgi:hypothetical protein